MERTPEGGGDVSAQGAGRWLIAAMAAAAGPEAEQESAGESSRFALGTWPIDQGHGVY